MSIDLLVFFFLSSFSFFLLTPLAQFSSDLAELSPDSLCWLHTIVLWGSRLWGGSAFSEVFLDRLPSSRPSARPARCPRGSAAPARRGLKSQHFAFLWQLTQFSRGSVTRKCTRKSLGWEGCIHGVQGGNHRIVPQDRGAHRSGGTHAQLGERLLSHSGFATKRRTSKSRSGALQNGKKLFCFLRYHLISHFMYCFTDSGSAFIPKVTPSHPEA